MGVPLFNASSLNLTQSAGTLPQETDALYDWLQPMNFTTIVKTVVNFQVVETPTVTTFQGVLQPFTARQLLMKPEGQRNWRWFTAHCQQFISLAPDDIITYQSRQFRVMAKLDEANYGYQEYHCVEDYTS